MILDSPIRETRPNPQSFKKSFRDTSRDNSCRAGLDIAGLAAIAVD